MPLVYITTLVFLILFSLIIIFLPQIHVFLNTEKIISAILKINQFSKKELNQLIKKISKTTGKNRHQIARTIAAGLIKLSDHLKAGDDKNGIQLKINKGELEINLIKREKDNKIKNN